MRGRIALVIAALAAITGCSSNEPEYLTDIYGWPDYVPDRLTVEQASCFGARFGQVSSINLVPVGSRMEDSAFSVLVMDWAPDLPLDDPIPTLRNDFASLSPARIRNLDGFTVDFRSPETTQAWTGLVWQKGPVLVVVAGPVLTSDEVAKVAESIRPGDAADFEFCH